jgi:hypothetical protein
VSVYAEEGSADAMAAARELGRRVAAGLPEGEATFPLVEKLPEAGLERESVRLLYSHEILNFHLARNDPDMLGLGGDTPAVLARYRRDGDTALVLLVRYPTAERAQRARAAAERVFGPGDGTAGDAGEAVPVRAVGPVLAAVLEAGSPSLAGDLLAEIEMDREE